MTYWRNNITHLFILAGLVILFIYTYQSPLLGDLGFEAANLLVIIFGPLLAFCASMATESYWSKKMWREYLWLFFYVFIYFSLLAINGLFKTSCSEGAGLWPFLWVLIPPLVLNVALGLFISCLFSRISIRIIVILAIYLAYALWIIISWWHEPYFRIFTHLSLIISSDLLNGDSLSTSVIGFRLATLMLAVALLMITGTFFAHEQQKRNSTQFVKIISLCLIAILLQHYSLKMLGKNASDLHRDYHLLAEKNGLRIFADPTKVSELDARAMLNEALFYQDRIKKRLGNISLNPINIWLHAAKEDKYLYTGAKNVHFALPKHREIHIDSIKIPHPVLGHELAHIYVGEYSSNIFGAVGGVVIPNLALTEGLAMMLTRELNIDDGLVMLEQAQSLHAIGVNPNIEKLFANNIYFALFDPRASYIFAGAALEFFLHDNNKTNQTSNLQSLIYSGSLSAFFTNKDMLDKMIKNFNNKLAKEPPLYARMWAKKSFAKESIILSNCHIKNHSQIVKLKQAILNEDDELLELLINTLSPDQQKKAINQALSYAFNKPSYTFALQVLNFKEPLVQNTDDKESFFLEKIDTLINLTNFHDALALTKYIDESLLDPSEKRLWTAKIILLEHCIKNQDNLSKNTLYYLTSARSQQSSPAEFLYSLGQATSNNKIIKTLGLYLYARLLMRNNNFVQAKKIQEEILSQHNLPDIFIKELLFMMAKTAYEVKAYDEAIESLEKLSLIHPTTAESLLIDDQMARIRWAISPHGELN